MPYACVGCGRVFDPKGPVVGIFCGECKTEDRDQKWVSEEMARTLAALQGCCLDDDRDFKRVAQAVTDAAIRLLHVDREQRS